MWKVAFTIRATKKLLSKLGVEHDDSSPTPTTLLGDWYATFLHWRSPPVLFLNERTLLSVLVPLAPAKSLGTRFPLALAEVLRALGVPSDFIDRELTQMRDVGFAPTASATLVGVLNGHSSMLNHIRAARPGHSLLRQSLDLSEVPTLMSEKSATCPIHLLQALVDDPTLAAGLEETAAGRRTTKVSAPESDLALVESFCGARVPTAVFDQVRLVARRRGATVTIIEEQATWRGGEVTDTAWMEMPVAQLRWNARSALWSLYWADSDDAWHRYDPLARCSMKLAICEIDLDPFNVFWG